MPSDSVVLPSHPASPFLNHILTQWTDRRQQARRDNEGTHDRMAIALSELDGRWEEIRNRRQERWETFEQKDLISASTWAERLHRIEEWRGALNGLRDRGGEISGSLAGLDWFDRAQELGKRLAAHLDARSARLEQAHTQLHEQLEQWLPILTTKEIELKSLKKKAEEHSRPFLVSRGRKQPELDYLTDNLSKEANLGVQLQSLRKAVALSLGRLYNVSLQLENHARVNEDLFEIRRKQIVEDLKETQNQYFGLREKVLADALLYESCRRKLRWVKQAVNDIRCIEDVYKAPESIWKKFVSRF